MMPGHGGRILPISFCAVIRGLIPNQRNGSRLMGTGLSGRKAARADGSRQNGLSGRGKLDIGRRGEIMLLARLSAGVLDSISRRIRPRASRQMLLK